MHRGFLRQQEQDWDMTRHIMYYAAMPNLKKGTKIKDLIGLPSDNKKRYRSSDLMTPERFKELKELWLKEN